MIITAVILALTCGYFLIGITAAKKRLPTAWERAREEWHYDDTIRSSVRGQTFGMVVGWPIYLTVLLILGRLDRFVDAGNPALLAKKLQEREAYIAKLEREAGIK